jgi:hypothetical protein
MIIDANEQSAYAVGGGVPVAYASAHTAIFSYEFVEFANVTVKAAYFDTVTLEPGD